MGTIFSGNGPWHKSVPHLSGHRRRTRHCRVFTALTVLALASCSSQEDSDVGFDYAFGATTASEYSQAMYDAALSPTGDGARLVDKLAGGEVITFPTFLLFDARQGDAGLFLGDNYQEGARSKLLQWWDLYGEDPDDSVFIAVGMVDFENRQLASAAARAELLRISQLEEELALPDGLLLWGSDDRGLYMFWVASDSSVVTFLDCERFGKFASDGGCSRETMLEIRDEIELRLTGGTSPNISGKTQKGPMVDDWQPLVEYEIDVDVLSKVMDPSGLLRSSWGDSEPPRGRYAFAGRVSSYAYKATSDTDSGPGLQVIMDQIPIKSREPALELTETLCFSVSSGEILEVGRSATILGGQIAPTYFDPDTKVIDVVQGHIATSSLFLNFVCGRPLISDDIGLTETEVSVCREVITNLANQVGSN